MRRPRNRNKKIDLARYYSWVQEFEGHRHNVSEGRIRDWLDQFKNGDRDIAARLLDCVDFITHDQIAAAFRAILRGMEGWHEDPEQRIGRWRFAAYSASAGESGDSMLHKFRHANNLSGKRFDKLFIYRSDIVRQRLGPEDTLIFVDDFVGSGDQVYKAWNGQFGELVADIGRVYLVVVAARRAAIDRLANETELEIVPHRELVTADNVFESKYFTSDEKKKLLSYCRKADYRKPKGHGDCGLLVVFSHTCPNNSVPILHKVNRNWHGLFRRYD